MNCGIEFEYMFVDTLGEPGRIRDFGNLELTEIAPLLADKPGLADPRMATGDLGIRSGYWYLEGDERFDEQGAFRTLVVKGVEVRTPPARDVRAAVQNLLELEAQLSARLAVHGLGLAISAFNPQRNGYAHDPPLNLWEQQLRRTEPEYGGSLISTVTYGPDVNLSMPGWSPERSLDAARKLNSYGPYLVPFSFYSPFAGGQRWDGSSKRTWERAGQRPVVKLYLDEAARRSLPESTLVHSARSPHEHGRIEFKAFDAVPSAELLTACAQLLVGVCLDDQLTARSEDSDIATYRRAARHAFEDAAVYAGSQDVLRYARAALLRAGDLDAVADLAPLATLLERRCTPAHALVEHAQRTGRLYWPGGLARAQE